MAILGPDGRKKPGKSLAQKTAKKWGPVKVAVQSQPAADEIPFRTFQQPVLPPRVVPRGERAAIAMDDAMQGYGYLNTAMAGMGFPGYAYLAQLSQRSEYRAPAEVMANEMVRNWIKLTGCRDEQEKDLNGALEQFNVRNLLHDIELLDSLFGCGHLAIEIKGQDTDEKRRLPLVIAPETVPKGSLLAFRLIEPMWATPQMFNATDPFAADYYKVQGWFVIGKRIHESRMLTFISRPMPDILKPAYNFGGISMSQLIEPYVNRWLKTVDSVNRLISNFSIRGIKTNLLAMLADGSAQNIIDRVETFNRLSDNRGTMMLDKETEDFFLNNVPLRGLDLLQAQAQEHMAAPTHIPLVKLTGVSPTGLNATSDGEIQVFYDWIKSEQLNLFSEHLKKILDLLQLNLWGKIEPNIGFEWVPLETPSEVEMATIKQQEGTTDQNMLTGGVVTEDEVRQRLKQRAGSGYGFLSGKAPGKPAPPPTAGLPGAKKPIAKDSNLPEAAGVCFVDENEKILLMHRTDGEGWAFPAGGAEGGESPDMTARREASEETGWSGEESLALADMTQTPTLRFYTFKTHVKNFTPILNSEHDKARWFTAKQALMTPLTLHPGVRDFLLRWKAGE